MSNQNIVVMQINGSLSFEWRRQKQLSSHRLIKFINFRLLGPSWSAIISRSSRNEAIFDACNLHKFKHFSVCLSPCFLLHRWLLSSTPVFDISILERTKIMRNIVAILIVKVCRKLLVGMPGSTIVIIYNIQFRKLLWINLLNIFLNKFQTIKQNGW